MMSRYAPAGLTIMMSAPSASSSAASRRHSRKFAGSIWYSALSLGIFQSSFPGRGADASASRKGP